MGTIDTVKSQLIKVLGGDKVISDMDILEVYSKDETSDLSHMPDLVVRAEDADDVSAVLRICNTYSFPVVPRGAVVEVVVAAARAPVLNEQAVGACHAEADLSRLLRHVAFQQCVSDSVPDEEAVRSGLLDLVAAHVQVDCVQMESASLGSGDFVVLDQVTGGAAGVGRATTSTVVQTVVAVIIADLLFTGIFFKIGWT